MEWVLVLTLFSTKDVFLAEHKSYEECIKSVREFKKEHRHDRDIKKVECAKGIVIPSDYIVTENE